MEIRLNNMDVLSVLFLLFLSFVLLRVLFNIWQVLYVHLLSSGYSVNFKGLGKYAAISGATDGIGKAYAFELARMGLDIILMGRSPKKLSDVAQEIESVHKVKTRSVVADFAKPAEEIYPKIEKEIEDCDIGVLVNNVGMGFEYPERFLDVSDSDELFLKMVNVNAVSCLKMCQIVLPQMRKKGRGVVINISSASADRPSPLLSVYSAAKVFVDYLSQCLQFEEKDNGLIIQSVVPLFVATKMSKIRKANFFAPSPDTYARAALRTVGRETRTYGCLSHAIQAAFIGLVPHRLAIKLTFNELNKARLRALKKKQSAQQASAKQD